MSDSFNWIGAISAGCSVSGAMYTWHNSRTIKKDRYNRLIEMILDDVEALEDLAIKFWSNTDLKDGERSVLESQIAAKSKNIARRLTSTRSKFPKFMGDNSELIQEFNSLSDQVSGEGFQSKTFKPDKHKINSIISESSSVKKILDQKLKI